MIRTFLCAGLVLLCLNRFGASSEARPLQVEDAVRTRRLATHGVRGEVAISSDGLFVAYILKAPDIANNSNNYELFVKSLGEKAGAGNGRLLLHADRLSELQWLRDNTGVAVISVYGVGQDEEERLSLINVRTGQLEEIASPTHRIRSFGMADDGSRLVICAAAAREADTATRQTQNRFGFSVTAGKPIADPSLIQNWFPDSYLYLVERKKTGTTTTKLKFVDTLNQSVDRFNSEVTDLALSPDGKHLLFKYSADTVPDSWAGTFYGLQFKFSAFHLPLWGLLDLDTKHFETAFDAPAYSYMPALWSPDGHSFVLSSLAPQGSNWEAQDHQDGFHDLKWQWDSFLHLFVVDIKTHLISQALPKYKGVDTGGVVWLGGGSDSLLIPIQDGVITHVDRLSGTWQETSRASSFVASNVGLQALSADGELALGLREDVSTPPNLVVRRLKSFETYDLTDWNPEFRTRPLGSVEKVNWVNKFGVRCWGYLVKPPEYSSNERYPLVVMNKPRESFFVSDSSYTTAFPPQPLASVGFAVLMVDYSFDLNQLPKNFPGGLAEAFNWMAMVESGIDMLVHRDIVDRNKIGIIGFSRTSWKTDFMLTHSKFAFAAASSADSGLYNYGVYWLTNSHGGMADSDQMFGGPPYGKSLKNWVRYSPALNAERVSCPLLMEYVGFGHQPFGPTNAYEFFTALNRQGKPVELFFYPDGDHPLDTPSERIASLQRNVDWFRFWIQGYEGSSPAYDPHQYDRWRELRDKRYGKRTQSLGTKRR